MRNMLGLGGTYRIIRERIVRVHWVMHLYFYFKSIYLVTSSIGILKLMDGTSPYRFHLLYIEQLGSVQLRVTLFFVTVLWLCSKVLKG